MCDYLFFLALWLGVTVTSIHPSHGTTPSVKAAPTKNRSSQAFFLLNYWIFLCVKKRRTREAAERRAREEREQVIRQQQQREEVFFFGSSYQTPPPPKENRIRKKRTSNKKNFSSIALFSVTIWFCYCIFTIATNTRMHTCIHTGTYIRYIVHILFLLFMGQFWDRY